VRRKQFKKLISFLLIQSMIICLIPLNVLANTVNEKENLWEGRSAVFVGDSITAGSGTSKIYYQYLEESLGFETVTAMGVGGSCISSASDYGQNNRPLINRYKNIPTADLISIFMGTNDYGHETPLGDINDTQDGTFYGALNVIIPDLIKNHPSSKIVFVTPLHRYGFGTSKITGKQFTYDNLPNGVDATLEDYVNALKTVCDNYGVTVLDLYSECTLDPTDASVRLEYMPDGLHPNANGHEILAKIMESHIKEYTPVEKEPITELEMMYGNKFSPTNNQTNRASSRHNLYLKSETVITLNNPVDMQWACAQTSSETSANNLGYFPDTQWTDKTTAVVKEDGWVGFVFKYRDETNSFDLTKPLSDFITIQEPHEHQYENGICEACDKLQLEITTQPQDSKVKLNDKYYVTVEAKGEGLKYQWYIRNEGSSKFSKSSVTTPEYTNILTKARVNRELYCVITDAYGNKVTTETVSLIRDMGEGITIVSQPQDSKVKLNDTYYVSVEAKGEGLKYQWYIRNEGSSKFSKSSVTTPEYTNKLTKARVNRELYCVITDAYGNKVQTDTVKLIQNK